MHPKKINLALLALLSVLMPLTPNVTAPFSMSQVLAQTPSSPKPEADRPNGVQVKDVPGWNNTRWGMTIKEVQALYPFRNTEPSIDLIPGNFHLTIPYYWVMWETLYCLYKSS